MPHRGGALAERCREHSFQIDTAFPGPLGQERSTSLRIGELIALPVVQKSTSSKGDFNAASKPSRSAFGNLSAAMCPTSGGRPRAIRRKARLSTLDQSNDSIANSLQPARGWF